jgi:hypothetical protein
MNTSQTPPGGWVWYEPSTGWWAPHPIGHTYDQQIQNIIKHRRANPAVVAKHNLSLDPQVVGQQLIQYQQKRGAIAPDPIPKLTPPLQTAQMSGGVRAAVAAVKKMASGAALLFEWQEAGMPHVERDTADRRAAVCVKCPKNERGKSLTDIFTAPVAAQLKKKMEKLAEINLFTSVDSELAVCSACACPLKTKVWVPLDLILKRLKPEVKQDLHESCWITHESKSFTSQSPTDPKPSTTVPVS